MATFVSILSLISLLILGYAGASIYIWAAFIAAALYVWGCGTICWLLAAAVLIPLMVPQIRLKISGYIVNFINKKGLTPKISETERIALRAGTAWIDEDLFSGKPNFDKIWAQTYPQLSKDEQSYMDNQVNELCKMTDDWEVQTIRDLPPKVWKYLKDEKFLGMIIPKKHGGLGFTALGHSAVVAKLATRSQTLAISTMVPNSLGPAELLLHYGTEAQKKHYLPRLADGRDIPCFALTEPMAGSDATSIEAEGLVVKQGGKVKIKLNFEKRYITLGAIATVIGLAFKIKDPDNLLGKGEDVGITCALIPGDTKGITRGHRHDPLAVPFVNAPIWGKDVLIDTDHVIGGKDGLGKGWLMLMECLAVGRGISLPSTSAGGSKFVTRIVGDYAKIRSQFGVSIGKFEAIEAPMADIAGKTYMLEAMRKFTAGGIDNGEKPSVINAVAKYHSTERFREIVDHGMDILGGAAICRGPRNLLSSAYFGVPVGITVEGANIMTRGLIQFGQGAVRCHPYSYDEMCALIENDIAKFDKAFFGHLGHLISNLCRNTALSLTRGYCHLPKTSGLSGKYERKIAWASAKFAFWADIALAYYGASLKRKESISGRFGDILSYMYMATAIIKRYEDEGIKEHKIYAQYALEHCFDEIHQAFDGLLSNFASGSPLNYVFKFFGILNKLNPIGGKSSDYLKHKIAKSLMVDSEPRDNLTAEIYLPDNAKDGLGRYENAFKVALNVDEIKAKIKGGIKAGALPKDKARNLIDEAKKAKVITAAEAKTFSDAQAILRDAIMVDSFEIDEYLKYGQKGSASKAKTATTTKKAAIKKPASKAKVKSKTTISKK